MGSLSVSAGRGDHFDMTGAVREATTLVFRQGAGACGARQALCWFHEHDLDLPVKQNRPGQTEDARRPIFNIRTSQQPYCYEYYGN